jgi:signal transduction histidine kinase
MRPWIVVAALAGLSLVTTSRVYLSLTLKGVAEPLPTLLATELLRWGLWIPVVPLVVALDRRWGFGAAAMWPAVLLHLGAMGLVLVAHTVVTTTAGHAAGAYFILGSPDETFLVQLVHEGATVAVVYASVLGLHHVRLHLRDRDQRRTAQVHLEAMLARERLRNLQMQLHPHFLFNALHAVGGLLRDGDRDTAVETVSELGELLRRSLRRSEQAEVTVEEEVQFALSYLKIQQARYGPRLRVHTSVDEGARTVLVPHLALQPLVENAVAHGSAATEGSGTIEIAARIARGRLVMEVTDDGPGPPDERGEEGIGLRNTRERLNELYDGDFTLCLEPVPRGGTRARIEIPAWRVREVHATPGSGSGGHASTNGAIPNAAAGTERSSLRPTLVPGEADG